MTQSLARTLFVGVLALATSAVLAQEPSADAKKTETTGPSVDQLSGDACKDHKVGDPCSFQDVKGEVRGVCTKTPAPVLQCMPGMAK
jgi:hypothetical protein